MQNFKNRIPILGINEFRKIQIAGRAEILFNKIDGVNYIGSPHKHDFFIIMLFDVASGVHNIDGIDYNIGNKEVHVLFPGQVHTWNIKANTRGYQLMISPLFLEQFASFFRFSIANYQNNPVIKLSDEAFEKLKYEFIAIFEELKFENSLIHVLYARASVIAAIVSSQAEASFTEFVIHQSIDKLANFKLLIDEFYRSEKSVSFYAEKLNISANYLNILCKKNLKVSAMNLIHHKVLVEAKRLLQSNIMTIKEVAYHLGFKNNSYFSIFFKKQTGIAPSDFRSSH